MSAFSYTPGSLVAVGHGGIAVLLDLPADHELVEGVHSVLTGPNPSVDEVLDVLVSLGLRTVATFAIAEMMDAGVRVVVRGEARALVSGREQVLPSGLWENRFLDGVRALTLVGAAEGDGVRLSLTSGVVLASAMAVRAPGVDTRAAVAVPAAPLPVDAVDGDGPAPAAVMTPDEGPASHATSDDPASATSDDPAPATSDDPAPATSDDPAPATSDDPAPATPDDPARATPGEPAAASQVVDAAPVGVAAEATGALPDFDHLFGATVAPGILSDETPGSTSVEPETSKAPEATMTFVGDDASSVEASPDGAGSDELSLENAGSDELSLEDAGSDELRSDAGGIIAGLPWEQPGFGGAIPVVPIPVPPIPVPPIPVNPVAVPVPPPVAVPVPHEAAAQASPVGVAPSPRSAPEMTIDRDQLIEHGGAADPLVVAARCPEGHLSPAYAGHCRVCGQALLAQQPFEVARPSLGVLRLSNGDTVSLDRSAVLGRNPRLPDAWTGEQPNLVKIHDPNRDVSGQHLEVRLDFWHVLVRDLGSTNGTEVVLPGAEPVTLRAHDAMAIEPGTRVILAGVFDFTYEVTA